MRFRRLKHFTEQLHIDLIVNIIASICVVHNLCIDQNDIFLVPNDELELDDENDDYNDNEIEINIHNNRRAALMDEMNHRV